MMIPPVFVPISYHDILGATKTTVSKSDGYITQFEDEIADYIGCNHCISTFSGRTALYVLLKAYDLKKNDEIAMPAYMCETVSELLYNMGLKIKFIDVENNSYNISVDDLSEKVTKHTKAILAVHMFGYPCDMSSIKEIADDYGSVLIEDAAQSMGAEYHGKKVGTIGDAGFFSFGRGKPITTINGGAIVTNDTQISNNCKKIIDTFAKADLLNKVGIITKLCMYSSIRNRTVYGIFNKIARSSALRGEINISQVERKYTNLQALIGLKQLKKLDKFNTIRRRNAELLKKELDILDGVETLQVSNCIAPSFLRFPIQVSEKIRNELMYKLKVQGIDTSVVYPATLPSLCHTLSDEFHNANEMVKTTIALPVHPYVNISDIRIMINTISHFVGD